MGQVGQCVSQGFGHWGKPNGDNRFRLEFVGPRAVLQQTFCAMDHQRSSDASATFGKARKVDFEPVCLRLVGGMRAWAGEDNGLASEDGLPKPVGDGGGGFRFQRFFFRFTADEGGRFSQSVQRFLQRDVQVHWARGIPGTAAPRHVQGVADALNQISRVGMRRVEHVAVHGVGRMNIRLNHGLSVTTPHHI